MHACWPADLRISSAVSAPKWLNSFSFLPSSTSREVGDGRLCITSNVHVAKVLTAENRHEVLPGSSSAQASMAVQPAEPTVSSSGEPGSTPPQASGRRSDSAEPLTAELSRLHVTVSKRFLDK